jgi:hypothetical protein
MQNIWILLYERRAERFRFYYRHAGWKYALRELLIPEHIRHGLRHGGSQARRWLVLRLLFLIFLACILMRKSLFG